MLDIVLHTDDFLGEVMKDSPCELITNSSAKTNLMARTIIAGGWVGMGTFSIVNMVVERFPEFKEKEEMNIWTVEGTGHEVMEDNAHI